MFRESRIACAAVLMFAIGASAASSVADAKSSTVCGSLYTVERGDTLFKIADRAYANGRLYKKIFNANRDLLPNMGSIEIGDQILIPCLDGNGPATRSAAMTAAASNKVAETVEVVAPINLAELDMAAAPIERAEPFGMVEPIEAVETIDMVKPFMPARTVVAAVPFDVIVPAEIENRAASPEPVAVNKRLRILTGAGFTPYTGKLLLAGGMVTDLITRGMKNVAPDRELRVSFINDWEAHLGTLLPDNSFDVSFPWIKPDCSETGALNETARSLCANFEFSNPFFEVPVGYYTRTGDSLITALDPASLRGKRICRPEGQFQFGPPEAGLTTPNVEIMIQPTAIACLTRLMEGEVDVVNLVKSDAETELRKINDAGQIGEIEGLATTLTLHAVVAKSSPNGQTNLAIINQGLASLMASGEWFEVVVRHRSERLAGLN